MEPANNLQNIFGQYGYLNDAYDYVTDAVQRSVLFMDTMRQRGNIYFEHKKNNKPPVLTFDYDVITDGRDLKRPVNFSLVRISDRRNRDDKISESRDKRQNPVAPDPL